MKFHEREALIDSIIALRRQADKQFEAGEPNAARTTLNALLADCDKLLQEEPTNSWVVNHRQKAIIQKGT